MNNISTFATEAEAWEWLRDYVNDPYIDNYRFAFLDDDEAMAKYNCDKDRGCCGYADVEVLVNRHMATIGCNYGH